MHGLLPDAKMSQTPAPAVMSPVPPPGPAPPEPLRPAAPLEPPERVPAAPMEPPERVCPPLLVEPPLGLARPPLPVEPPELTLARPPLPVEPPELTLSRPPLPVGPPPVPDSPPDPLSPPELVPLPWPPLPPLSPLTLLLLLGPQPSVMAAPSSASPASEGTEILESPALFVKMQPCGPGERTSSSHCFPRQQFRATGT